MSTPSLEVMTSGIDQALHQFRRHFSKWPTRLYIGVTEKGIMDHYVLENCRNEFVGDVRRKWMDMEVFVVDAKSHIDVS